MDTLRGGEGNDEITDYNGVRIAEGQEGNDNLYITFAADWKNSPNGVPRSDGKIIGGYGDDYIVVTMNNDKFFLNMKGDEPSYYSPFSSDPKDGIDTIQLFGSYANSVVDLGGGTNNFFYGGDGNDDISGRDGKDFIDTGKGNDRLVGGAGNDVLYGGAGNDTYVLHSTFDSSISEIQENANEGTDTVELPFSFSLTGTGTNLENITLTGTDTIDATGDQFNNVLKGNNSKNTLIGRDGNDTLIGSGGQDVLVGGAGNDKLTGGEDGDFFVFSFPSEAIDKITDFQTTLDQILVSPNFGGGLTAGSFLTSEQFVIGSSAETDANRFIYNAGKLFFDEDGIGNTSQIQIATLGGKLTYNDIYVDHPYVY